MRLCYRRCRRRSSVRTRLGSECPDVSHTEKKHRSSTRAQSWNSKLWSMEYNWAGPAWLVWEQTICGLQPANSRPIRALFVLGWLCVGIQQPRSAYFAFPHPLCYASALVSCRSFVFTSWDDEWYWWWRWFVVGSPGRNCEGRNTIITHPSPSPAISFSLTFSRQNVLASTGPFNSPSHIHIHI